MVVMITGNTTIAVIQKELIDEETPLSGVWARRIESIKMKWEAKNSQK